MELQDEADSAERNRNKSKASGASKAEDSTRLRKKSQELQHKAQRLQQAVAELEEEYISPLNTLSKSLEDNCGSFRHSSKDCCSAMDEYMQIMDSVKQLLDSSGNTAAAVSGAVGGAVVSAAMGGAAVSGAAGGAVGGAVSAAVGAAVSAAVGAAVSGESGASAAGGSSYSAPGASRGSSGESGIPENQSYVQDVAQRLGPQEQELMQRDSLRAAEELRAFNLPRELDSEGRRRGSWVNSDFHLQGDYVPQKFNPERLSFSQLQQQLKSKYDLDCGPVSYENGSADFGNYSLIRLSCADIVMEATGMSRFQLEDMSEKERSSLYAQVFSGEDSKAAPRASNFDLADELAARRHLPIPGLPDNYTPEQLKDWRNENKFTWDESLITGYSLVPAVIHGNLSHSGLVSSSRNTEKYFSQRDELIKNHPEKISFAEEDAPLSAEEYIKRYKGR